MNKKVWYSFGLMMMCVLVFAQPKNDKNQYKIDGIAAVVGGEIILNSDIDRDYYLAKSDGMDVNDKCEFLNNTMIEKMLVDKAKQDTLIEVTTDEVNRMVESQVQDYIRRAGGNEKMILDFFGMKTMAELKNEMQYVVKDNIYTRKKQQSVTKDIDASPAEVLDFFKKNEGQLPDAKDEVELSQIIMYPEISPENEQKVIDELKNIKKEVQEGASFATKAILYSEDPGSSSDGGLYNGVKRGKMVPEFDAVAFNLQEGEISEPFKTDFGYHIIYLEKRKGQELDLRHILITLKPTDEEINKTKNKLDSIRVLIDDGKMSFKDAANQFSVDKYTKFNAGKMTNPQSGEDRFEKEKLNGTDAVAIAGLVDGQISQVFNDKYNNREVLRVVRLDHFIPAHKINYDTDFARLKSFTQSYKQQQVLMDWVKKQIPDSFIKIGDDYKNCKFSINWIPTED